MVFSDPDPHAATPKSPDWRLLQRMTRPAFLAVTAVACLLGLATAAACGSGFDAPRALAITAAIVHGLAMTVGMASLRWP